MTTYSPNNDTTLQWSETKKQEGYAFSGYMINVAKYDSCAVGVKRIVSDFGHIDALVNNAGITRDASFRKMTLEDLQIVNRTNLDSVFSTSKHMLQRRLLPFSRC